MDEALINIIKTGEMTQDVAQYLFLHGGILILKDFPEGSEFGIDCRSWTVGRKFLGIKMIPPGIHFVYMSVPGAPKIAFFHNFVLKEIVLRKWDKKNEDLFNCVSDDVELERVRSNLMTLDSHLGAYPFTDYQLWASFSSSITSKTLKRLSPTNKLGRISSQVEMTTLEAETEKQLNDPLGLSIVDKEHRGRIRFTDESGLPVMNAKDDDSKLGFTEIPKITLADTCLKKSGIDASDRLEKFVETVGDSKEVLAELQFAFIIFIIGEVYEGFDQWKRIIHLLCSCKSAIEKSPSFFNDLLMVLHYQMKMVPDNFFAETFGNNFLVSTLSLLFANIEGFDQWKRIIHLLCSCKSAIEKSPSFFNDLLMVLHYQMKMVPDNFFAETL
uniref:Protein AAR2 homolog n=1 Tax=Meloidogyne incognita TaxID=6306 RepID=A0A914MWC1_MELIC